MEGVQGRWNVRNHSRKVCKMCGELVLRGWSQEQGCSITVLYTLFYIQEGDTLSNEPLHCEFV